MSSKRRLRRRECEKKQRYSSREIAARFLAWMQHVGRARPGLHVYECQFCHGYHLGRETRHLRRKRVKAWQWNMGV